MNTEVYLSSVCECISMFESTLDCNRRHCHSGLGTQDIVESYGRDVVLVAGELGVYILASLKTRWNGDCCCRWIANGDGSLMEGDISAFQLGSKIMDLRLH